MRILAIAGVLAATMLIDARSSAQAAAFCAWYDAYTYDCGYYTFQQCLDTIRGVGGYCARNVYEAWPRAAEPYAPRPSRRKHARRHD
jgi:hypothetical protein